MIETIEQGKDDKIHCTKLFTLNKLIALVKVLPGTTVHTQWGQSGKSASSYCVLSLEIVGRRL